jgi:hypothetical protein
MILVGDSAKELITALRDFKNGFSGADRPRGLFDAERETNPFISR